MAQLRLIALALALVGCRRSEAAPGSGLTAPAGWQPSAELARSAADAAKSDAVAVTGSEAWAEPARGCYGFWLMLHGAAGPIDVAADQLVASVSHAGVAVSDVAKPPAGDRGVLGLAFAKAPYHGNLRAELAKTGEVAAVACMWNDREPKACAAGCAALLGSMR
jgi:hypothetical protein